MPKEKTISDYIAKDNKELSFDDRAKKFEVVLEQAAKELGVAPGARLISTPEAIVAVPGMNDLWDSGQK